jgi:hypothetical protein
MASKSSDLKTIGKPWACGDDYIVYNDANTKLQH